MTYDEYWKRKYLSHDTWGGSTKKNDKLLSGGQKRPKKDKFLSEAAKKGIKRLNSGTKNKGV